MADGRFLTALTFGVALQLTAYLLWAFNVFGGYIQYPLGDVSTLSTDVFKIDVYTALLGIGGGIAIGLASILLKQGINAIYAMLLWGIGIMFNVIQTFFLAIPNTIGALIPPDINPNPEIFGINPIIIAISTIFVFFAWIYLFKLVVQRA